MTTFDLDGAPGESLPPKRRNSHPEHRLQTAVGKFVRGAVIVPHRFACFDRTENDPGGKRHMWEAARFIKAGEPDTELLVKGFPAIRIELKAKGGKEPTEAQKEQGRQITAAGHLWDWADSVAEYGECLVTFGVPLAPNWHIQAEHQDALILSGELKRKLPKKPGKPRAAKPSGAYIKRMNAIRGRTPF